MKRIVLVFGLIAGVILSVLMITSAVFADEIGVGNGYVIGYTSMVLAFLLTYFGIRSYRDDIGGGAVSFGKAFVVGISITIVASLCYVASWEFVYHRFFPDFMEKYSSHQIDKMHAAGAPQAKIDAKTVELKQLTERYRNPLFRLPMTFIEAFPVGLILTLVSAAILRKRRVGIPAADEFASSPT